MFWVLLHCKEEHECSIELCFCSGCLNLYEAVLKAFLLALCCSCRAASFVVPDMSHGKNTNNTARPCSVMLKGAVGVERNET